MVINGILLVLFVGLGMAGGQRIKGLRRFGIPGLASLYTTYKLYKQRDRKEKDVTPLEYVLLLLTFLLSMGYGENSWLMKVCRKDYLVRIVYGLLLSIPFLILGFWFAPLILCSAWSIRAGGFKITDEYDFLFEDLIRYSALGICIINVI